jgi:hypothetical protein
VKILAARNPHGTIQGMKTLLLVLGAVVSVSLNAAEFRFGAASVDITPDKPVALDGQRNVRVSKSPETPITATALALESRDGGTVLDQAIIVSCDLVAIREGILQKVREKVQPRLKDFDARKLFLSATHTHTAPVTIDGKYNLPADILQPGAYAEWMTARVADVVVEAWQKRAPGKVGWGQGQAVVAQNRRSVFADGSAAMYGKTDTDKFRGIEGYEDHNLEALFFWDAQDKLVATAINVACPAQEVGGQSRIHADFWHPVREQLRARHGAGLQVVTWNGAGGDVTSRLMYGTAADTRMRKLRGLSRLDEVARRIINGWTEAYDVAQKDKHASPVLRHAVRDLALPLRVVTEAEAADARKEAEKFAKDPAQKWNYNWNQSVVTRFELQKAGEPGTLPTEVHVLRLGDVAIASNQFELFTDYGVQMKARSPAVQTFVIQLAGPGTYLPTERAVRGGGYSAVIQSSRVGPNGGQALVEHSIAAMKELWPSAK